MAAATPMMEQFQAAKRAHPDCVCFFRMGDFYEMFGPDAERVAPLLGIALTSRDKGPDALPMAGVPVKAVNGYLKKLVALGERVAICEQVEDARAAKGLVRREVVRVVTAGTLTEDDVLAAGAPNYCAAVAPPAAAGAPAGLAWADLSTGEFACAEVALEALPDRLSQIDPAEALLPAGLAESHPRLAAAALAAVRGTCTEQPPFAVGTETAERVLREHFGVATLRGFGLDDASPAARAAGALLRYLAETQKGTLAHVRALRVTDAGGTMTLDRATQRALELSSTLRDGGREGTLLAVLDHTRTGPGARRLRAWLHAPLVDAAAIRDRQAGVAALVDEPRPREQIRVALRDAHDLERLAGRLAIGRATPRDCHAIGRTLAALPALQAACTGDLGGTLARLAAGLAPLPAPAPLTITDGGIFRDGWDAALDELRSTAREGGSAVARFQQGEIARTGIASLRVGYTSVFGYYLEVPKGKVGKVPDDYKRRQTLKNVERYVTPELLEFEKRVLGAEERARDLERELFEKLRAEVAAELPALQVRAAAIAELDALQALAEVADRNGWCRPEITEDRALDIRGGRHPVVEAILGRDGFVPNDCVLDGDARLVVLTGPNMAGKSTFIRQVALQAICAQIGGYVPAASARLGVVDRVFARVGAADELARGASTFMVEMTESANICHHATERSLIVLDEIGRGTSTFDGVSIAWAMAEHLRDAVRARTLFATHYHELTALADRQPGIVNWHVAVAEDAGSIAFLHQIRPGISDRSYGVHVAQLAGVPPAVVLRAAELLARLETADGEGRAALAGALAGSEPARPRGKRKTRDERQLALFAPPEDALRARLRDVDVNALTPLAALQLLDDLRRAAREEA